MGTLGGGNHFIEADKDEEGKIYLVIHSGSRHLGLEVAEFYQEQAFKALNGTTKKDIDALITSYKEQGREKEIQELIAFLLLLQKQHLFLKSYFLSRYNCV